MIGTQNIKAASDLQDKVMLEVCCGDIESVIAARDGGADRVELCMALADGGVTPSYGLMLQARKVEGIRLNVLIRPRGGDFLYNEEEVEIMVRDIELARQVGADAVVIGALTADGDIDIAVCKRLIAAAKGMEVTFHRAFDVCRNATEALEQIILLGCHRVLTSGQQASAEKGVELLKQLVSQANGRISIMPGSGVLASNAAHIIASTGAREIHASAREQIQSNMRYRNAAVSMGTPGTDEYARLITTTRMVNDIRLELGVRSLELGVRS